MPDVWRTAVVAVPTPRGVRYRGVCYIGTGGRVPWRDGLPRGARTTYQTRLHVHANEAGEQARSHTIHANLTADDRNRIITIPLSSHERAALLRLDYLVRRGLLGMGAR